MTWPAKISVLGTGVTPLSFAGAIDRLSLMVESGQPAYVSPANAYSLTLARKDTRYREAFNNAAVVTADGMPVVWMLRKLGYANERVHNDDLVLECCRKFPHWRHFLVGGRVGQPEAVAAELERRFPGIQVVGMHPTPQRPVPKKETVDILDKIENSRPSVVWVALGTPAQDYWMNEVSGRVNAPMVGCGSLFDLLAGRTRPAPDWVKKAGLQWLFRLCLEPRRLAKRYAYYNSLFIIGACHQLLTRESKPGQR